MNLIYIHGLDSDANSTKGLLLEQYCQQHHTDIIVHRPDLNQPPQVVLDKLLDLIAQLSRHSKVVLIGSSLGGYFATLISNETGCPALLINPSTQPHVTLQRFSSPSHAEKNTEANKVVYTTTGGWMMTQRDLKWFAEHKLLAVDNPSQVAVMLKQGDELLDANLSAAFYRQQGATVTAQAGGDHRFSDFKEHLPQVVEILKQL